MLSLKKSTYVFGLLFVTACGQDQDSDREETGSSSLVSQDVSAEALSLNINDALSILSETSDSRETLSLQRERPESKDRWVKSCEANDDGLAVSITGEIDRSISFENRRFSFERSLTGSLNIQRQWSHDSLELACDESGKRAEINFASEDVVGLSLEISSEKTKSAEVKKTSISSEESRGHNSSFSLKAERQVDWLSFEEVSDESYKVSKSVSSESQRERNITKPNGEQITIGLSMLILAEDPLVIETVRSSADHQLISKKIVSGSISGINADSQRIVTSFSEVEYSFVGEECQAVSGSIEAEIYAADAEEASMKFSLSITDGDYVITNVTDAGNPVEVEDFDFEACDLADFRK